MLFPRRTRAQQPMPLIGFLHSGSMTHAQPEVAAFWQGLGQTGFAEHHNVAAAYRWADGRDALLPALAADLVHQGAAVIVAGGAQSVAAVRQASATVPIVFVAASDPAGNGADAWWTHAGANITGVSLAAPELMAERLEMLHRLAPDLADVVALVNPGAANVDVQLQYVHDQAKRDGMHVQVIDASGAADIGSALDAIAERQNAGLVVANDGFLNSQRERLVALTTLHKIPAAFANREFVEAGGLMSYGPSFIAAYRQAGIYAGRLLKGEKAADLPVQNPAEFELALNAKTAKALDLHIPPALAVAAAETIE